MYIVEQWCSDWYAMEWDAVQSFSSLDEAISLVREEAPIDAIIRITDEIDKCIYFISPDYSLDEERIVLIESNFVSLEEHDYHESGPWTYRYYNMGIFHDRKVKEIDYDWKKEGF